MEETRKLDGVPIQCNYPGCDHKTKIFPSRSSLLRHMRVHTGEKPHRCMICGKSFSQAGNLTKHSKTHDTTHLRWNRSTKCKPFKCPHEGCGKSFTAKSSLQSHLLSHRSEILKFSDDSNVAMDLSNNVKNSYCMHIGCNKIFDSEDELRQHLYSYSPGIVAEYIFLRESVLEFTNLILDWDNKTGREKAFFRKRALGVKEMVESIPAPLNPLSLPTAATATHCENDEDDGYGGRMNHKLDEDDLASEEILSWLGCTGFGEEDEPPTATNMPPDLYSMQPLQQFPYNSCSSSFPQSGLTAAGAAGTATATSLNSFIESISAGWRQHAILTSSPAVTATVAATAAYCVPFTVLESASEPAALDLAGEAGKLMGRGVGVGTEKDGQRDRDTLPIAVADATVTPLASSNLSSSASSTSASMSLKAAHALDPNFVPAPPTALKRIRSGDQSPRPANPQPPFAFLPSACCPHNS